MSTAANGSVEWDRVRKSRPCQYCQKYDERCMVAKDRSAAICYRVGGAGSEERRDTTGTPFYLYRSEDVPRGDRPKAKPKDPNRPPLADPQTLHEVYTALLESLALSDNHQAKLGLRGFPEGEAERIGYRTMPRARFEVIDALTKKFDRKTLVTVPGLFVDPQGRLQLSCLPGLLIPVRNRDEQIRGLMVRPDEALDNGAKYLWVSSQNQDGPSPGAPTHVPVRAKGPSQIVRVTEGILKADLAATLSGMPTIGCPGVSNWRGSIPIAKTLGAGVIRLAFDADWRRKEPVRKALVECAKAILAESLGLELEVWDEADGKGLDDLLATGKTPNVLTHRDALIELGIPFANDLPLIVCGSEDPSEGLKTWTPKTLDAIAIVNSPPFLFQRGGKLCRIKQEEDDAPPMMTTLSPPALRGVADRAASWGSECFTKRGIVIRYGPPRMDVIHDILALPAYDPAVFPYLDLVVESPRFLPDGRLVLAPGYDPDGRLYYAPPPELVGLDVPERPTREQVRAAVSLLVDDLLVDFPFKNQASRANAIACMLLPFVRQKIDGPTPNHHYTSSTEGVGKGLCGAACAYPSLGRELDLNPQKEDEAEWRKALTSAFMSGSSHFFIDNMYDPVAWNGESRPVDSGTLAMAWTARYYRDRILCKNENARIKVQTVFMSSGNNVSFSRELKRRLVLIELLAKDENPSERTGFKHDDLMKWARENRAGLVVACLTIVRHWIAQGCPNGSQVMGTYESYARVMGGILGACGIEGFLANRPKSLVRDSEGDRWNALVELWHSHHQSSLVSTSDLWNLIGREPALSDRFGEILGDGTERSQKTRLGKALERHLGRVWGKWRVTQSSVKTRDKASLWRLLNPEESVDETEEEGPDSATTPEQEIDWAAY